MERDTGIFGLDEAQVASVLEEAIGAPIAGFTVQMRPPGGGSSGSDTRFCDFQYETQDGSAGQVTLLVKRCVWRPETVHYHYLAARGLPDWSPTAPFLDAMANGSVSHRELLTRHYLEEYARLGGETVPLATFRDEASALFWAHKVTTLPWMLEGNHHARIQEVLDALRHAAR